MHVQVLEGVKSCECFGLHLTDDIGGKNPAVGESAAITTPEFDNRSRVFTVTLSCDQVQHYTPNMQDPCNRRSL